MSNHDLYSNYRKLPNLYSTPRLVAPLYKESPKTP